MKSIKIILLSFSLAASLAVTSYAMSPNKNKTTTVSNYNLRNRSKDIQSCLEEIQLNENKKSMEINTSKDDMKIDQIEEKKIPTQKINIQSEYENEYYALLDFYNRHLETLTEYKDRMRIKELLKQFKKLFPVNNKNNITKNKLSKMSISDFNQLQSILLDYYNFSVSFTAKYSPFITLGRTHTKSIKTKLKTNKNIYSKFYKTLYIFLTRISKYVKILNNFCYNLLFEYKLNAAIQNLYFNNINTESTENEELNEKTLERLSGLSSDLQKIFETTQTEITPKSTIWGKTFSKDQFTNNTFIDEDTTYNKFEVTPNNYENYEIPIDLKDKIPHQYKINAYILAAVYKMELLKSQYYMKKLKDNPLEIENENTGNIFKSYDEAKRYANDIFKTYNSLRSFIVLDKGLSSINSSDQDKYDQDKDDQDKTTALEIFKKDAKSFNEDLKKYTSEDTNNVYDLISFLICGLKKNNGNGSDKKDLLKFISKSDFNNKYHIDSIPKLYNHISNNNESYNQLFGIYNVQDLKKFYLQIDENTASKNTNSNSNKENEYQSLNKFLDSDVIDILKNEETKSKEPKKKKSKNEESKNERSYTNVNLNLNVATGLLKYYNRNWRLDKNQRKNILKRLEDFGEIYDNFNSKEKIQKNANLLNKDFNSLQSILLDYYKFLLFFSKYNNLIKIITTKTSRTRNYKQLKGLTERKSFVDNYKSFTDQIKGQVAKIKTFVNEMLTENFKDPKNTNIAIPETNLAQLLKISEEIQKLEPNFKKIFEIMEIDKITGNKVLDEKTSLEDIDVIPEIDKNEAYLQLYSINAAPPHFRVNLDILATILKMEILKWLPYFKKMPNTTILNDQENNTDINFTQSKKEMSDYINTIYQFYDKLKNYMVWSMNDRLFLNKLRFSLAYAKDKNKAHSNPSPISKILGEEEEFMKKIQDYIIDYNQFYTTFYLPPDEPENSSDESNDSSEDQSKKPSTKKDPLKDSTKPLSLNLFKMYYDRRQDCADQNKSQITLFAKHILKKQEIYDNFMNNNDPNISDMKLLDLFFSRLDPGYFSILSKENANKSNPIFVINKEPLLKENKYNKKSIAEQLKDTKLKRNNSKLSNKNNPISAINNNLLLKENKDNKKSIVKQLKDTKLKRNNSNQNTFTYNNTANYPYIFQENSNKFTRYNINKNDFDIFNNNCIDNFFSSKNLKLQQPFEQNYDKYDYDLDKYDYDLDKNDQYLNILSKSPNFEQIMFDLNDYQNDMNNSVYTENRQIDLLNQTANNRLSSKLFEEQALQNNNFIQKENDFIMNPYSKYCNENEPFMDKNEPFMLDDQNNTNDYFDDYYNHENYKLLNDRNELSSYLDELIKVDNQINNSLIEKNAQQTVQNQNTQFNNNLIENYEGLTQINQNQNQQQYIQNIENESEEGFNNIGIKEKKSKKTKPLLRQKTPRENDIKKYTPSKKKKKK